MGKGWLKTITNDANLYLKYVGHITAVKIQKQVMVPTEEEIDHWTSGLYNLGYHMYHILHAMVDIIIPIVLFVVFIKVSWKVATSDVGKIDELQTSRLSEPTDD